MILKFEYFEPNGNIVEFNQIDRVAVKMTTDGRAEVFYDEDRPDVGLRVPPKYDLCAILADDGTLLAEYIA